MTQLLICAKPQFPAKQGHILTYSYEWQQQNTCWANDLETEVTSQNLQKVL
jgi:hypothetical protein